MKWIPSFLMLLIFTSLAFGQVQVLWDVPLGLPVTDDSTRHMRLNASQVWVWGGAKLDVFDTLGAQTGHWEAWHSLGGYARIFDVAQNGGEMLVAHSRSEFLFDTAGTTVCVTRFDRAGDSLASHSWAFRQFYVEFGVFNSQGASFAGMQPAHSLAPMPWSSPCP